MRIILIPIGVVPMGCLLVTMKEMAEAHKCENCGKKAVINHQSLAKEIPDWCLECNDEEIRKEFTDEEYTNYCIEQTTAGKAVIIAVEQ